MNELSERLRTAVEFLKRNGYATMDSEIARAIHVQVSTFCMVMNGTRVPNWGLLLDLCDVYPIDFRWLRTGKGGMVKEDREAVLLKRIEELETEIARMKGGI